MKKLINLTRKPLMLTLVLLLFLSSTTAYAAKAIPTQDSSEPVLFNQTITVTADGGRYDIGFVQVDFRKNFIGENEVLNLDVQVYAENGLVYIEFDDVENFIKDVKIQASNYNGLIYDLKTKENIYVEIPNQVLKVEHFSRYCFSF